MFVFRDYYKIVSPNKELETHSDSVFSGQSFKKGLEVKVEATHSGLLNNNMRFYLPSKMRDGAQTFNNRKHPAKILKHHNSEADPVGIITNATYIETVPQALLNDRDVRVMLDGSLTTKQQLAAAKRFMKSGIPFSDGWRGLGYIEVTARIFDEETIEQVKDGRFDAVSTSFRSPGEAYCNICGQNLVADGMCEHEWGKKYADSEEDLPVVCAVVPGMHLYDEISFVVFAADPITAISVSMSDSIKDYAIDLDLWKEKEGGSVGNSIIEFKDFIKEEQHMDKEFSLSEDEQKILDAIKPLRPEVEEVVLADQAKKLFAFVSNETFLSDKVEAELSDELALTYALEALETAGQEVNADEINTELEKELELMKDEGLLSEEEFADAKLSTEKRSNLSNSTFCGPDRSFPVPDCAHVTAARRLIGRYKGPGDKTAILACVSRKAKALGCGTSSDSEKKEQEIIFAAPSCEQLKVASDKDIRALFAAAETEMIDRRLTVARECSKCEDAVQRTQKAETEKEDLVKKLSDANSTLKVLRDELRRQYNDYSLQVDDYVSLGAKLESTKAELVALKGTLSGKFKSIEDGVSSLKGLNLEQENLLIQDSFKLDAIVAKLNDGMSREPKIDEPLTNPIQDNNTGLSMFDGLSAPAKAAVEQIKSHLVKGKLVTAKSFYDKMVAITVLDKNVISFESLADSVKSAD
jgi:hypothetical protein